MIITPDDILKEHSALVQQISQQLQEVIQLIVPEMTEKAYPGWHGIGYRHPQSGYVCGIFPDPDSVKLLFEHGVQLSDPHGVLQGEGKQTRYIQVTRLEDIPVDSIRLMLVEAIELTARPNR